MGKDKHESEFRFSVPDTVHHVLPSLDEDLIKFAWPQDVWFHVDKLSSAHVYLRMPDGMAWDHIPEPLLVDCGQLVKANSIEGRINLPTRSTIDPIISYNQATKRTTSQ